MLGHGLGTDQACWLPVARLLGDSYRLCLFNQAGTDGDGPTHREQTGLEDYARDLLDLRAELGLRGSHYVGHSAGGMIGLLASLMEPGTFRSLTLICASPCYLNKPGYRGGLDYEDVEAYLAMMDQNFLGWAEPFASRAAQDESLAEELVASFQSWNRTAIRQFAREIFLNDYRSVLARVKTPTLLIHNERDDIVPVEAAEFLHRGIEGSLLTYIPAPGHCPHLSHPQSVSELIRQHVGQHQV